MHYDYVIIGGGIAGVSAAEAIRSKDAQGRIAILSKEDDFLYSRVLLPSYVRGKIAREKAFLRTENSYTSKNIDLYRNISAVNIDFETREINTSSRDIVTFGKLLISAGGTPIPWNIPGSDNERVMRLQTIADADKAHAFLQHARGSEEKLIVVGGSFIALEFIESAVSYGLNVESMIREKKFFGELLDDPGWEFLNRNFERHGVVVHKESQIKAITESSGNIEVDLGNEKKISGIGLGIGIGVARNLDVFQGTGIDIGRGIVANQYLETSRDHVWTAGDITEYYDVIFNEHRLIGNWTNAFMQGRVAGLNMAAGPADAKTELRTVSTYSITNLGCQITMVGRCEVREGVSTRSRIWELESGYERFFFEGGILKGAIIFNRFADKTPLTKLIETKADLSSSLQLFADPNFNVASLLSV